MKIRDIKTALLNHSLDRKEPSSKDYQVVKDLIDNLSSRGKMVHRVFQDNFIGDGYEQFAHEQDNVLFGIVMLESDSMYQAVRLIEGLRLWTNDTELGREVNNTQSVEGD